MVRPPESLGVYNQKQNILFISESVDHRRSKVTWARLGVYSDECSGVCMAECTAVESSSVCTTECTCRVCAWPGGSRLTAWMGSRLNGLCQRLGRARVGAVRDARLGYSFCTTWMGAWLGLVMVHDLVGTRPRFGRDARIGCTRAKLYGHDRAVWLVFRNVHMQLKKEEACN